MVRRKESLHGLIRSSKHGKKSFNLDVEERNGCMEALFNGNKFDKKDQPESVINILERYRDIQKHFPKKLEDKTLLYFTDWLLYNVYLVEIATSSDVDAYTIFVTMNDRGLPLTSVDKLKGYFLSKIKNDEQRNSVSKIWQEQMLGLKRKERYANTFDEPAHFVKSWLIGQYAKKFSAYMKESVLLDSYTLRWYRGAEIEDEDIRNIHLDPYRWVCEHHKKSPENSQVVALLLGS